jgi:hypothetical protein
MKGGGGVIGLKAIKLIMIPATGSHFGTRGEQFFYKCLADAVGAAGDNDHFIPEIRQHVMESLLQTYFKKYQLIEIAVRSLQTSEGYIYKKVRIFWCESLMPVFLHSQK